MYKTVQNFGTTLSYDNVYQRTVAYSQRIENVSLTYSAYTNVLGEFSYVGANVPLTYAQLTRCVHLTYA